MSKIIVHCGAHKTGSTLLQSALARYADDLRQRGIHYVDYNLCEAMVVKVLRDGTLTDDEKRARIREFVDGLSAQADPASVMLSHESIFSYANMEKARAVGQFYPDFERSMTIFSHALDGYDLQLIFYIRRQDTFLESIYLEGFQRGYIRCSFETFLKRIAIERVSWLRLVEIMERFVPTSNIRVRVFEEIRHGSAAFIRSFFSEFCDPEGIAIEPIEDARRSLSRPAYFVARAVQERWLPPWPRQRLISLLLRYASNRRFRRLSLMDEERRDQILRTHCASNKLLFQRYLPHYPERYIYKCRTNRCLARQKL